MKDQIGELKKIEKKLDEIYKLLWNLNEKTYDVLTKINSISDNISKSIDISGFDKLQENIVRLFDAYYNTRKIIDNEDWIKTVKYEFLNEWRLIKDLINVSIRREIKQHIKELLAPLSESIEEIQTFRRNLSDEIYKIKREVSIRVKILSKLYNMGDNNLKILDNKVYNEDELLSRVLELLLRIHQINKSRIKAIHLHKHINGIEFDAIIEYTTTKNQYRTIAVELKETDVPKLIKQLEVREQYVNYIYGIVDVAPEFALKQIIDSLKLKFFIERAGLICFYRKEPILLFRSKYKNTNKLDLFINQ